MWIRKGLMNSNAKKKRTGAVNNHVVATVNHNQIHVDQSPQKSINGKTPVQVKGFRPP